MNSDQNTRTNRDQEKINQGKAGISPTTQAAAAQSAAGNRQQADEASAPLKQTGDKLEKKDAGDGQNPAPDS